MFCCDKSKLVATKVLSWQAYLCHNKHVCLDKTHLLSQQKYACDKTFVLTHTCLSQQKLCLGKHTFECCECLSWQKSYLWQLPSMIVKIRDSPLFLIDSCLGIADCIPQAFLCLSELDEQGVHSLWSCLGLKVHEGNCHTRQGNGNKWAS